MKGIFYIILVALLFSCKKNEPTSWDTDWAAPVAHGHLTLGDLIPPDYTMLNSQNYISIVYHEPVYSFNIDTIVDLPDTTIIKKSAVEVNSFTMNPGFSFTDTYDQEYELDQIELKKVRVSSGTLDVQIKSPWQGASLINITFPKITIDGIPFTRSYALPAGSITSPSVAQDLIDMAYFMIDMTGTDGNQINVFSAEFEMGSNETTNSYQITDQDSVEYVISFNDLKPDYAKGYFGQYHFTDTVGISLDFMKNITDGLIDVDSIDMTLTVRNGFNLLAQAKITQVLGINTRTAGISGLSFPMLNNSMNINPATGGMYAYTPSEFPIVINNTNSNIASFIENMSDSILLGYELDINPFGNITAGSDEIFPGSVFQLFLDAEFPLSFGADDLTLVDTFEIDYTAPAEIHGKNAEITVQYTNGFPIGGAAYLVLLDEAGQVLNTIQSSNAISAGAYDNSTHLTTPAGGQLVFDLDESDIADVDFASHLILNVSFSSHQDQVVRIDANAFFDFLITSTLSLNIEI